MDNIKYGVRTSTWTWSSSLLLLTNMGSGNGTWKTKETESFASGEVQNLQRFPQSGDDVFSVL